MAEAYDYVDEEGALLYQAVRKKPKGFFQRRPNGKGGWINSLGEVRRVLYHLPDVLAAARSGKTIWIAEGEKDVNALRSLGASATCNAGGAGKWLDEYSEVLRGANVIILPDNDRAGLDHSHLVAASLQGKSARVRVVLLPDLPPKGDVSDWLAAGGALPSLVQLAKAAPDWTPEQAKQQNRQADGGAEAESPEDGEGEKKKPAQTAAQRMVEMGRTCQLFHNERDENFARFQINGHWETWALRSKAFRDWLGREYFVETGRPAGGQAVEDAIRTLEGYARFDGEMRMLNLRTAAVEESDPLKNTFWYDLSDPQWQAVKITSQGWEVVAEPPTLFRRYAVAAPQSLPEHGGGLDCLRDFVNVRDEAAWRQMIVWLVAAMFPSIAHPVLVVHGEQGSAKSTLMRVLALLLDPSKMPLRTEPRDPADWVQAADHAWLTVLDNVSHLPSWLSDAICRAVTGEGFVKRMLYTDSDDVIISYRRVIALTGIEVVAQRADLLDRSILLALEPIAPEWRRAESEVLREFEAARPALLGALLDTLAGTLRELPAVHLSATPRMADFARIGVAVERTLCWPDGAFLEAYAGNITEQHQEALSSSAIGEAILSFMSSRESWEGTAKELLEALSLHVGEIIVKRREWPKSSKSIGGMMRRIAPNLRATGTECAFLTPHGKRLISLTRKGGFSTVPTVPDVTPLSQEPESGTQHPTPGTQMWVSGTQTVSDETHGGVPIYSDGNSRNGGNANLSHRSVRPERMEAQESKRLILDLLTRRAAPLPGSLIMKEMISLNLSKADTETAMTLLREEGKIEHNLTTGYVLTAAGGEAGGD